MAFYYRLSGYSAAYFIYLAPLLRSATTPFSYSLSSTFVSPIESIVIVEGVALVDIQSIPILAVNILYSTRYVKVTGHRESYRLLCWIKAATLLYSLNEHGYLLPPGKNTFCMKLSYSLLPSSIAPACPTRAYIAAANL